MTRRILLPTALLVAAIAAAGFAPTVRAPAAESSSAGMHVISSDMTARFVSLGFNKSVVIDLPRDIKDVLVASPSTVNAVVRSNRRAYIIGTAPGQTNVYFYDADGQQIGALNVVVADVPQLDPPPSLENSALPGQVVIVYRGVDDLRFYRCTPTCSSPPKPKDDDKASTTNSDSKTTFKDANGVVTGVSITSGTTSTGK